MLQIRKIFGAIIFVLFSSPFVTAQLEFWSISGQSADVDGAVDGLQVPDHLGGNNYNGYVGQLVIMPTDPSLMGGLTPSAPGLVEGDTGGTYQQVRGIAVFCIDSETAFLTSANQSVTHTYVGSDFATANSRYINEGVSQYRPGALLRAAYLIDRFYDQVHAAGDIEAAALQTAIWEVLYDAAPDVETGQGNYYVRNNTGNSVLDGRANQIIAITDGWFASAASDNWGGPGYDPTDRVIFWIDPTNPNNNQSVISLNPWDGPVPVPELGTSIAFSFGLMIALLRRRR
ncbi:hypothetical protein HZ994_02805 [Akkermansiaceae bacterium]|nr:hypothetical protein HZ994_02805 [Akkermansiaceae bacterium]